MIRYILSCTLIAVIVLTAGTYFFSDFWEHRFDDMITRQARIYRVDSKLVWSLIYEETWFKSGSKGEAGEVGLMQITPLVARQWAKETGLKEFEKQTAENVNEVLLDPERNIQIGCWYFEKLREKYRGRPAETAMTLAAYNAGPSRVEEWASVDSDPGTLSEAAFIERINIPSTRSYVTSILERYRKDPETKAVISE